MTPRGTSKDIRQATLKIGLELFRVHPVNLFSGKGRLPRAGDHEAVGRFFDASQGRPADTSFEGGNKSGATSAELLDFRHAHSRKIPLDAAESIPE